jgi:2-polyprenyl-6-methoxyphenol hydroxylase-like FAD-dependent oxidoreductase
VVVIGNGPVGQTTALILDGWGIPTVVLDGRPARDLVGSKSICQARDVLDVWAAVGAGQRIAKEGVTWSTARTFYRDRELFSWSFVDRGRSPLPPFVNISQAATEQLLDEAIAARPRIDVRWEHEVAGVEQDADGVTVRCRTPAGEPVVRAPYAVACAGARGDAVRRSLGVAFEGRTFDDRFLICDIRAELPGWETERRFYFDPAWNPDRQVLIHPCPGSMYRIDWQVPAEFDLDAEAADGRLDARIRQIVGDRPYEILWRTVYRFHSRHADRMRVGRVLLAGDCAHLVAPFGARGLNSGVADAENAAWKLAFVLRGWAPPALLATYHDERLAAALENIEVTTRTMDFLVPHSPDAWAHRRSVLDRAARDPESRGAVDSGRFSEPFWYLDSPLTTRDPSRPFAGRPPRGETPAPAPGVLIPDAPIHDPDRPDVDHLREIVRDGLLALTCGAVDTAAVAAGLAAALAAAASPAAVAGSAVAESVVVGSAVAAAGVPRRVLRMEELDRTGQLRGILGARDGEIWLIRPDGHIAAVARDPAEAAACALRALARV